MKKVPYSTYIKGQRNLNNITGVGSFDEVMINLQAVINEIKGGTLKGLIMSAAHIRRETEDSIPKTPVDTGNLRESWFVVTTRGKKVPMTQDFKGRIPKRYHSGKFRDNKKVGHTKEQLKEGYSNTINTFQGALSKNPKDIALVMGYAANYAFAVHENVYDHFKRPGSGAKWFEIAIKNNTNTIFQIIGKNAKI